VRGALRCSLWIGRCRHGDILWPGQPLLRRDQDAFRDPREFRRDMDRMLKSLRNCPPAEGAERVYFAGQKEFEQETECLRKGVPLLKKTYDQICTVGDEHDVAPPPTCG